MTKPALMGILNVTPDSFSDGGCFAAVDAALTQARAMVAEGADIIDIGGESTRPGFTPVSAEEEIRRVRPVLEALAGDIPAQLSIDTTKAEVARMALAHGVTILNDIWGLQGDPALAEVAAENGATVVAMHNRHHKDEALNIAEDMLAFFERSLAVAQKAGLDASAVILDPGIGFGKTQAQQLSAIAAIPRLKQAFGLPVLVGLSRKSFLGRITGASVEHRVFETVAANLAAYRAGASLFRVHDVAAHRAAFQVFDAIGEAA